MVLWSRIRLLRIGANFNQCSSSINGVFSSAKESTSGLGILNRNHLFERRELNSFVRFFAAPVLVNKPKPDKQSEQGVRLNEKITADFIRLVHEEGHGVVSRRDALDRARMLKMDLVEVDRTAKPPVCKIMDYHKEKYKQHVKEKEKAKSKVEGTLRKGPGKEVRFTVKAEQKDLQIKADTVKRLMDKGYRVKCMAMAVGTEDQDLGGLLARLSALIEDVAVVESGPMVEKKQAYVIVRHVKFGLPKKGGKKTATMVSASARASINTESVHGPPKIEGDLDSTESHTESEDDLDPEQGTKSIELPQEDLRENKVAWSTSNENVDFDSIFGFDETSKGAVSSSITRQMGGQVDRVPGAANKIPQGATQAGENRYSGQSEVRRRFEPTRQTESEFSRGHLNQIDPRNNVRRGEPPYQVRQSTQDVSGSLSAEEKPSRTNAPPYGAMRRPPVEETSRPKQPRSVETPTPQRSSYGIFSAPNAGPSRPSIATKLNGESRNSSLDSSKGPNVGGVPPNNQTKPNQPSESHSRVGFGVAPNADAKSIPSSNGKQKSEAERGKYGIFSK